MGRRPADRAVTRPTFGVDRDPGVVNALTPKYLGGTGGRRKPVALSSRPNPIRVALGPGPEGKVCGDCRFLVVKHDHGSRRYYGCEKRGPLTSGPGTDHLVGWATCAAFEEDFTHG